MDGSMCQIMKFVGVKEATELLDSLGVGSKEHAIFALNDHDDPASEGGSHWSLMIHRREDPYFCLIDSLQTAPSLKTAKQVSLIFTFCSYYLAKCSIFLCTPRVQYNKRPFMAVTSKHETE